MALQPIDIDTPQPNNKRGDPGRVMSQKINANDAYLEQLATDALDALATLKSASKADILGVVSQIGGVPNGAIMEAGSNANGRYFRLASGLQLCFRLLGPTTIAAGASVQSGTMTFPATFSFPPLTFIHVNASFPYLLTQNSEPNVGPSSFVYSIRNGHSAALNVYHGYMAIGMWF